jgi:hypothetical protein
MNLYQYPQARETRRSFGARSIAGRVTDGLLRVARPGARELVFVSFLLFILVVIAFGSHVRAGGFYYDDWANAARTVFAPKSGYFGAVEAFRPITGFRPLALLYVPAVHEILGLHQHEQIAWGLCLAVLMSVALYLALSSLGFERIHAFLISALVLVFPFSDATRLWSTAATAHLVVALYLFGLVLALRGLDATTRRSSILYTAGSVTLYVIAVSTYEVVATVALCSVFLYAYHAGLAHEQRRESLKRALRRFVVDVVAIGAVLAWTVSQNGITQVHSTGRGLTHAELIFDQGLSLLAQTAQPFGNPTRTSVLLPIGAVVLLGVLAWALRGPFASSRRELGHWLVIAIGGVAYAFIAWAVFIPADPYYSPLTLGLGNRVNVVAAIGLVTAVYAVVMVAGTLVFAAVRQRRMLATALAAIAALALGVGFTRRDSTDVTAWNLAARDQAFILRTLRQRLPTPAAGSTILTFGFTAWTAPGVPVFAASWDLNGAAELLYRNSSLNAYPMLVGSLPVCGPASVYPAGSGYGPAFAKPYGEMYLVDIATGRVAAPRNRAQCAAEVPSFQPAPST